MTTPLLIAGHGTKDPDGVDDFRRFVARVGRSLDVPVAGGFIELSEPPVKDAVADLLTDGVRRLACVPLMLVAAGHAKGDIPGSLAAERARHPGLTFAYGRPLGPHPGVLALLRERLSDAGADRNTTVLLVGRGSTDPDANAEVAKVARLLAETTDVSGVEYAFVSLAQPSVPAGLDRCRALGAAKTVVLPYFLFTGVLPRRVATQAAEWATEHHADVRTAEVIGDCAGLAEIVVERYREALAGDIRANCDTCKYRIALPFHEHAVGAAQVPHTHPADHHHQH
ncbi:sirohydrochlorin chelatase [Asanoa siamensis]|uniref:Cobalamin biosynthesis protein CbiX n=1 Tax=Asanoa siamensis TaxID=926357 RepID=A0ABQ4CUE7_9ACTN|nr:sirohydrochlorin chelatase [Asanoa siamensis]GIF74895.1 cobalamin biosynthesis protein CbiX [Asanoa siamensis]